jgi:hypothetical protein
MDIEGDKDDLISRLVTKRKGERDDEDDTGGRLKGKKMKMLGDATSSSSALVKKEEGSNAVVVRGKVKISAASLPSQMHSMTAPQLRSVCAANGMLHLLHKDASKSEILHIIESECYDEGKPREQSVSDDDASDASDEGSDGENA